MVQGSAEEIRVFLQLNKRQIRQNVGDVHKAETTHLIKHLVHGGPQLDKHPPDGHAGAVAGLAEFFRLRRIFVNDLIGVRDVGVELDNRSLELGHLRIDLGLLFR